MSDFSDGVANVSALTTQINQIKESGQIPASQAKGATQADINAALLEIEKSFSSLLDGLLDSGDDKKKSADKYDPFSAPSSTTNPALNYINVPDLDLTL